MRIEVKEDKEKYLPRNNVQEMRLHEIREYKMK